MASRIPTAVPSLKQFLKRQEVLGLYRDIIRAINNFDNKSDKNYFLAWTREEFKKYKYETDGDVINFQIARARKTLKDLSVSMNLSK
ncbi:LYR motif-containing protein 2-like [Clavelina lepadiformis]|uniref:LYR motif-containing protein 2-like n=1 Tax=Clavelina lepadiformis TaxID=159417 RepID=UPI004042095A